MKCINENILKKLVYESIKRIIYENEMSELFASHGTTAKFDKFSLEFLGQGEGSQRYGYGIYVTDNLETGKLYADITAFSKLTRDENGIKKRAPLKAISDFELLWKLKNWAHNCSKKLNKFYHEDVEKTLQEELFNKITNTPIDNKYIDLFKKCKDSSDFKNLENYFMNLATKEKEKFLYNVEVPDGPYIDWNETNQNLILKIYNEIIAIYPNEIKLKKPSLKSYGIMFDNLMSDKININKNVLQKTITKILLNMGYEGIRIPIGQGVKKGGVGLGNNYVIFNPDVIKIIRIDNIS